MKFYSVTCKNKVENKLELSWAKLKSSLVRVVDKSPLFSTRLKLKLMLQLSYHYYSWWVGGYRKKNEINAILNFVEIGVEVEVELGNKLHL